MCEDYAEVVALWYICIIKSTSVCGLLKVLVVCLLTFSSTDSACTKALGHYFITFLLNHIQQFKGWQGMANELQGMAGAIPCHPLNETMLIFIFKSPLLGKSSPALHMHIQ